MRIAEVETRPFRDQKPGTAGLRKKVRVFQQPHYLENFAQAIFECLDDVTGRTLIVGGDGRYHNDVAIQTLIRMAAAHGIGRIVVGQGGLLSTPAASHLIRLRGAIGGFVLTASHNPAGPGGDFGVKFNVASGGQASEQLTNAIFERTTRLSRYRIARLPPLDLSRRREVDLGGCILEVIDPIADYAALMQSLFDFEAIRALLRSPFHMRFDAMHGVTGPYARRILVDMLDAPPQALLRSEPLADFGGGHPDPNLRYADDLVRSCFAPQAPDFAAASDGDGDRNMILGRGLFVSPGDSLAALARLADCTPGYRRGLAGVARSMPTSRAVDLVAQRLGIPRFETPTGWRFFCNLLEAGRITLCGEESFGTSSDHTREKDGLWAVLFWLNVLAVRGIGVAELMREHWRTMGRHYYRRHDYEDLDEDLARELLEALRARLPRLRGERFGALQVTAAEDFEYHDPVDGSTSAHQGLRIVFGDEARIVVRLSGTGTGAATLRLYLERYEGDSAELEGDVDAKLAGLSRVAERITGVRRRTGRDQPSLVT